MKVSFREYSPVTALLLTACFAAACSDTAAPPVVAPKPAASTANTASQPSVVGTLPDGTSKDTPATTSATTSDISKTQQSNDMPMPGQANDHSTLAPGAKQKTNPNNR